MGKSDGHTLQKPQPLKRSTRGGLVAFNTHK